VPLVEEAGERRVHGDAARDLGLRAFEIEGAEWVEVGLVEPPAQAGGFAVAEAGEALECVEETAVFEEADVGDEVLYFLASEDGVARKFGSLGWR
jgi:hypothetical protein